MQRSSAGGLAIVPLIITDEPECIREVECRCVIYMHSTALFPKEFSRISILVSKYWPMLYQYLYSFSYHRNTCADVNTHTQAHTHTHTHNKHTRHTHTTHTRALADTNKVPNYGECWCLLRATRLNHGMTAAERGAPCDPQSWLNGLVLL